MIDLAEQGRRAKLERLVLATSDMQDSAAAARYLLATHDREPTEGGLPFRVRRALEAGMFASYARAFNDSRASPGSGEPGLPPAPSNALSDPEIHQWALSERKRVWAHVDRGAHRRMDFIRIDEWGPRLVERWRAPAPTQLERLASLAEELAERYRDEAHVLALEIGPPGDPSEPAH